VGRDVGGKSFVDGRWLFQGGWGDGIMKMEEAGTRMGIRKSTERNGVGTAGQWRGGRWVTDWEKSGDELEQER
jgi:hypothetical protein